MTYRLADLHYVPGDTVPYPPTDALAAAMAALTDDGDTFETDAGTLVLHVEPDQDHSIFDDGDLYGQLAWADDFTDYPRRPDTFDGAACKLGPDRNFDAVWWQPPADVVKMGPDAVCKLRGQVVERLRWGYSLVGLELEGVTTTWLGGVDEFYPEIVGEMVGELQEAAERQAAKAWEPGQMARYMAGTESLGIAS